MTATKAGIKKSKFNPAFLPYAKSEERYQIYYGGRGSGKSKFVAQKLVLRCIQKRYFKCIYSRKASAHIRESQFSLLVNTIKEFGLTSKFRINKTEMKIECLNGNCFIAKGVDDPERVKSIDEPSHLWCEELPEFDEDDFLTLNKSIRTSKSELQTIVTFNPIMHTHWVRKHFFSDEDYHKLRPEFKNSVAVRTTFRDNEKINREEYYDTLMLGAKGSINRVRVDIEGDWGVPENNHPWLYAYDEAAHVEENIAFLPTFPVYLSFDFNRDPVTCLAMQMSPNIGLANSFVHFIKEFKIEGQLHELCAQIRTTFPASILYVTGDRTGNKGDVSLEQRNATYYTLIASYLRVNDKLMDIEGKNMEHNDSRILCNTALNALPRVKISRKGCPTLVEECQLATVDVDKPKAGVLKKDREIYKMDLFDCFRYHFQTHFKDFVDNVYLKRVSNKAA